MVKFKLCSENRLMGITLNRMAHWYIGTGIGGWNLPSCMEAV